MLRVRIASIASTNPSTPIPSFLVTHSSLLFLLFSSQIHFSLSQSNHTHVCLRVHTEYIYTEFNAKKYLERVRQFTRTTPENVHFSSKRQHHHHQQQQPPPTIVVAFHQPWNHKILIIQNLHNLIAQTAHFCFSITYTHINTSTA